MTRSRTATTVLATCVVAASLAACSSSSGGSSGGGGSGKTYTIIFAGQQAPPNPIAVAQTTFKTAVEKASNGRIKVQVHTAGDLGGPAALLTDVKQGTIQMTITTPQSLASYDDAIGVVGLPFLFTTLQQASTALASPAGVKLAGDLQTKTGIHVLAWEQFGIAQVMNRDKDIKAVGDMQEMKIRTIANKVSSGIFSKIGATPVPLDGSEIYTALQQKTIDGNIDPIGVFFSEKDWEISKHLTIANVQDNVAPVVINQKFFASLPKDLQADVTTAAQQVAKAQVTNLEKSDQDEIAQMQKSGVAVVTMSPAEIAKWKAATLGLRSGYDSSTIAQLTGTN